MNVNAFANGRYGPTSEPMLGRFPSIGSATNGHSKSSATAPAEARSSAPTPTPRTAASTAYSAIAPTSRQLWGSESATHRSGGCQLRDHHDAITISAA